MKCKHEDFAFIRFHFAFRFWNFDYILEAATGGDGGGHDDDDDVTCMRTTSNTYNANFYGSTGKLPWG